MTSKSTWSIASVVALCLLMTYLSLFSGNEVCTDCGAQSNYITSCGVLVSRTLQPTPLSELFERRHIVGPHDHHWLFASGGSATVMCAIGKGRYLWWPIKSPVVITFFNQLSDHTDAPTVDRLRRIALDPSHRPRLEHALIAEEYPDAGLPDPETFKRWWAEHVSKF